MAGYLVKVTLSCHRLSQNYFKITNIWAINWPIWPNIWQIAEPLAVTGCLVTAGYWDFVATGGSAEYLAG